MNCRKLPVLIRLWALLFILVLSVTGLTAQDSPPTGDDPTATLTKPQEIPPQEESPKAKGDVVIPAKMIVRVPANERATFTYMNRKITRFRANVIETPPKVRAEEARERVRTFLNQGVTGPVETLTIPRAVLVRLKGQTVFSIVDEDLDLIAGETLESRAAEAVKNLEQAIAEAHDSLMPQLLLRGVIFTVLATLIYILLIWVLQKFRRAIEKNFLKRTGKGLKKTIAGQIAARTGQQAKIVALVRRAVSLIFLVILLVLTYTWLTNVLEQFPYTRPWGEALGGFLLGTLAWVGKGIISALPNLFTILVIFLIARWVIRLIHVIFAAVEMDRLHIPGIHPETAQPTRRILSAAVWLLAVVVAYPYFPGSSTDAFKGLSVFIGLVISLGSTGIVNQLMSGMMLMYSRALREGDWVMVGGFEGTVLELGMLSTKVRTRLREEVTVPNAVVISKETINYSRNPEEGVTVNTVVTIGYDTPWRQVHAMLEQAAVKTEGVRAEPRPFALQTGLSDHYPEYKLIAVIEGPDIRPQTMSRLHANIQDIFNEHGVQIMSPHYVADPPEPLVVPPDRRNPAPAPPELQKESQ